MFFFCFFFRFVRRWTGGRLQPNRTARSLFRRAQNSRKNPKLSAQYTTNKNKTTTRLNDDAVAGGCSDGPLRARTPPAAAPSTATSSGANLFVSFVFFFSLNQTRVRVVLRSFRQFFFLFACFVFSLPEGLIFNRILRVLLGFTGFYRVLQGYTEFDWV